MVDMQLPQLNYEYEISQNVGAQKDVHYLWGENIGEKTQHILIFLGHHI